MNETLGTKIRRKGFTLLADYLAPEKRIHNLNVRSRICMIFRCINAILSKTERARKTLTFNRPKKNRAVMQSNGKSRQSKLVRDSKEQTIGRALLE